MGGESALLCPSPLNLTDAPVCSPLLMQASKRGPSPLAATKSGKAATLAAKEYMESLPGVSGPLGFFDPLGFCDSPR